MIRGAVGVDEYDEVLYVDAHRQGDIAYTNGPPYLRVPKGDGVDPIGRIIREALDASTMPAPPSSPSPFLEWSGARSWSMFSKRSKYVGVQLEDDRILVYAYAGDRHGNFETIKGQQIELPGDASDEDLGGAVLVALERSTAAPTR